MRWMLDTNICIYLIKKRPAEVIDKIKKLNPADIAVSTITVSELQYGAEKSGYPEKNRIALEQFLAVFEVVAFDTRAASHYGEIRFTLEREGTPIGAMDLLIAAHARAMGLILVTNNRREFERVSGLCVENWVSR